MNFCFKILILLVACVTFDFAFAKDHSISGKIKISGVEVENANDCQNILIFIEPLNQSSTKTANTSLPNANRKSYIVQQKNKKFEPDILPILRGTSVSFLNKDHIFHNVFSLSKTKAFDLGSYPAGKFKKIIFDTSGLAVIYCNIHPEMIAYVLVLDYPYYSLGKSDCSYKISDIPDGKYFLKAWYRYGKGIEKQIELKSQKNIKVDFEMEKSSLMDLSFEKTKFDFKHTNKWGLPYSKEY